ncbi:MAG: ester cyclase [Deltaproteobacteria bacterium]|nr:ester cyclase [Deltaproteobacteria bacterium]
MPQQSLIDAAKAPVIAFGEKNWNALMTCVTAGVLYDEVPTQRKTRGIEHLLECWMGWSNAFPDAKATFHSPHVSGSTVVLEVTWHGTHRGPLETPGGRIPATGRPVEVPACLIVEIEEGKAKSLRHYFDMATLLQQIGIAKAA